jgi:hypothetical protein
MNASLSTIGHVSGALLTLGCALVLTGATLYRFVKDAKGPIILGQSPRASGCGWWGSMRLSGAGRPSSSSLACL